MEQMPLEPGPGKLAIVALIVSSGARKSPIRTSCPARGQRLEDR